MGTCISKCISTEECNPIEDKLVISQAPITSLSSAYPLSKDISKKLDSPPLFPSSPPTPTFSTDSTITTTTAATASTLTSVSSSSSSSISNNRTFSNEFLWTCVKENPQIIQVGQVERSPTKKVSKGNAEPPKQSLPRFIRTQLPKRAHEKSPSPARQKSCTKEAERKKLVSLPKRNSGFESPVRRFNGVSTDPGALGSPQGVACKRQVSSRGLSPSPSRRFNDISRNSRVEKRKNGAACRGLSPSPSRRFNGDNCRDSLGNRPEENCKRGATRRSLSPCPSRRFNGDNCHDSLSNQPEENCKRGTSRRVLSQSPSREFREKHPPKELPKEHCKSGIGSTGNGPSQVAAGLNPQVDQTIVGDVLSNHDSTSHSTEGINNPHISLDCFIFI